MGLMDSLKKATGLGLSHQQHYDRAYEKGVLLGPAKYREAAELFEAAAKKAAEAGDAELQARATANQHFYGFVAQGSLDALEIMKTHLEQLPEIEAIGQRAETIQAPHLIAEIEGRLLERRLTNIGTSDFANRALLHQQASEAFKKIFSQPLVTYRFHATDNHVDAAHSRFFLHQGLMSWNHAQQAAPKDPEEAAEHAGRSLTAFRQCKDEQWSRTADMWLGRYRARRTCWMCHREAQGMDVHFRTYPATVDPYTVALVTKLGQDVSSIDMGGKSIVLCSPCGSSVEKQADRYATKHVGALRHELGGRLDSVEGTIASLMNAVQNLQRHSHSH